MNGPDREPRPVRMPRGLLGMLVLVAIVEVIVARNERTFPNLGAENWGASRRSAERSVRHKQFLCFGTSLTKHGIVPPVLLSRTGRLTYNLALFSGPSPAHYFLLRRALESGARPRAVLIDYQDGPIRRDERDLRHVALTSNLRCWPVLLGVRDALDLSWSARDATFFAETMLAKVLASYRARFELRGFLLAVASGRGPVPREWNDARYRNWFVNNGAQVLTYNTASWNEPDAPPFAPGDRRAAPLPRDEFTRNKVSESYLGRFLDLAAARGITVFWHLPPIPRAAQADRDRVGLADYVTRLARRMQAGRGNLVVIDARHSNYPRRVFCDTLHLDRQGAISYSTDVAAVVVRTLAEPASAPRWVELPSYRDWWSDTKIEDYVMSYDVIRGLKTRR